MMMEVDDLLTVADNKAPSILLSLDISAAFDTVDHRRLLERSRELFGLDDVVLVRLHSYLTDRKQFVAVDGCRSKIVSTSTRLPQGSVLGPLLFSIFATPIGTLNPLYRHLGYHTTHSSMILNYALQSSQKQMETLSHYQIVLTRSPVGISRTTSF